MDTMRTTIPPIFRALRLLTITGPVIAWLLDTTEEQIERWIDGEERLPTSTSAFLVLFAAGWLAFIETTARRLPGRFQQIERNLTAAMALIEAQSRINESIGTTTDYDAAMQQWAKFHDLGRSAWAQVLKQVMEAPKAPGHTYIKVAENEMPHE